MKAAVLAILTQLCGATLLLVCGITTSCKQKSDSPFPNESTLATTGMLNVFIIPKGEQGQAVRLGTPFIRANGDTIALNRLDFYLSNLRFQDSLSKMVWAENDSYHLLQTTNKDDTLRFEVKNMKPGVYTTLTMGFGVDNAHNKSLDQRGDLSPSNGMAWDWITGYRYLVMEGRFGTATTRGPLIWHIGSDPNFLLQKHKIAPVLSLKAGETSTLVLEMNLSKMASEPNTLSPLSNFNIIMFDPDTTALLTKNINQSTFRVIAVR
jgi:hypothetical protein